MEHNNMILMVVSQASVYSSMIFYRNYQWLTLTSIDDHLADTITRFLLHLLTLILNCTL